MQYLQPFARRLLRRWEWVGLRLRKPVCQVQRARRRDWAQAEERGAERLPVVPADIRVCRHLRVERAERGPPVRERAGRHRVCRKVELLAQPHRELRDELGHCEREELRYFEGRLAASTGIIAEHGIRSDREDLCEGRVEQLFGRRDRRERMRFICVVLGEYRSISKASILSSIIDFTYLWDGFRVREPVWISFVLQQQQ